MAQIVTPPKRYRIWIADSAMAQPVWNGAWSFFRGTGRYRMDLHSDSHPPTPPWPDQADFDGFICSESREILETLRGRGRPLVCALIAEPGGAVPTVVLDEEAIGRVGAEHLIGQGYRRFGFYGVNAPWSLQRAKGFVATLAAHGLDCTVNAPDDPRGEVASWDRAANDRFARRWIDQFQYPAAVMAADDVLARVLANECVAAGMRIPRDLAILGVDDLGTYCEVDDPPLSSVAAGVDRVGCEAARLLDRLLKGQSAEAQVTIVRPHGVTVRESTSMLAYDDPEVVAALRFIRQHACEEISVETVCRSISISRRQLERRFIKVVGHTPFEEIRRQRMDKAKELLAQTSMSMLQIALRCGYDNASSFATMFRQCISCTPHSYREQHTI